jgi:hypothetical protein
MPAWFALLLTARAEVAPARIDADATWSTAGSPWQVLEDLTVAGGATLLLEPGVVVELDPQISIFVEGALQARGTVTAPITFTRPGDEAGDGRWGSIVFSAGSTPAAFEDIETWVSGSILEHCDLRYGQRALQLLGGSPLVRACVFESNAWDVEGSLTDGGAAIFVAEGSRARIQGCTFAENSVGGWGYGGAVQVRGADPVLLGNSFEGNTSAYGAALAVEISQSPIAGNRFTGNESSGKGGAVSLISAAGAFFDNVITGNHSLLDGGGVHVCTDCNPHAAPWVADCVITGNSSAAGAAGFGAAWLRGFSWNDVHDNLRGDDPADVVWTNEALDEVPAWVHSPSIPWNWWGTLDSDAIKEHIEDGEDEDGRGVLDWEPFAEGPIAAPTPRAVVTTPEFRYGTADEPMPMNLTVYNPGEARQVALSLFVRVGDGPLVPWHGDPGLTELVPEGDSFLVAMPAGALLFVPLTTPTLPDGSLPPSLTWIAALHDAASGELLSEPLATSLLLGGVE